MKGFFVFSFTLLGACRKMKGAGRKTVFGDTKSKMAQMNWAQSAQENKGERDSEEGEKDSS